ncbi:unnamed protein product, partial [Chrysoparadoxa australica]
QVWTCGQNSYGELSHGDTASRKEHTHITQLAGQEVVDVAAGNEHTVVLTRGGAVLTAGYNDNGQCGQGTTQRVGTLTAVEKLRGKGAVQVHAYNGCEHTMVVTEDGRLYAFGYNYRGQLGHGSTNSEPLPRQVRGMEGRRVTQVSCSYYHSVFLCEGGGAFTCGRNDFGQLGIGDTVDRKLPTAVSSLSGHEVVSLACGQYHTAVATSDGKVLACGKNDYGQLGIDSTEARHTMTVVKGALEHEHAVQLHCGYYHTLTLTKGGAVYGFGRNDYGQLGLGHITQRVYGPQLVEGVKGKGIVSLATGCYHSVMVGSNGMLYVCGRNNHGQLGTGETNERHSPHPIDTFLGKTANSHSSCLLQVAAGFYHTIILLGKGGGKDRQRQQPQAQHSAAALLSDPAYSLDADSNERAQQTSEAEEVAPEVSELFSTHDFSRSLCPTFVLLPSTGGGIGESSTAGGGICNDEGLVRPDKAALVVLAHMERLAEAFTPLTTEAFPLVSVVGPGQQAAPTPQALYCIDLSADTFELLLCLLKFFEVAISDGCQSQEQVPSHGHGAKNRYKQNFSMLLSCLRILKANLGELLRNFPAPLSESLGSALLAHDPYEGLDILSSLPLISMMVRNSSERATIDRRKSPCYSNQDEMGPSGGAALHASRLRLALEGLRHRLLTLVAAPPKLNASTLEVHTLRLVQSEAASVLMFGLEIFYPSQTQQCQLLTTLITYGRDQGQDLLDQSRFNAPLVPPPLARRCFLAPLLERLSDDSLAARLVPCITNEDDGQDYQNLLRPVQATLTQQKAVGGASISMVTGLTKLLLDDTVEGEGKGQAAGCEAQAPEFVGEVPQVAEKELCADLFTALFKHTLSWAGTGGQAESFNCSAITISSSQQMLCNVALFLTDRGPRQKHLKKSWLPSLPPVISSSHSSQHSHESLCSHSNSPGVLLRIHQAPTHPNPHTSLPLRSMVPPAWECLIDQAQAVLEHSCAALSTGQEIEGTIVSLVLPSVVAGLIPFAKHPVFASHLQHLVTKLLRLLDERCAGVEDLVAADAELLLRRSKNAAKVDVMKLPWVLRLAKSTAVLLGRLACSQIVGGSCISTHLEQYHQAPIYSRWLSSPLLMHGLDSHHETIMTRCGIRVSASCTKPPTSSQSTSATDAFLEGMAVGSGKGHMLCNWLRESHSGGHMSYRVILQQASRSGEGALVQAAEGGMLSALLKHEGLAEQALLWSKQLEGAQQKSLPPSGLRCLWGQVAAFTTWLWQQRGLLKASDSGDAAVAHMLAEAAQCGLLLLLLQSSSAAPAPAPPAVAGRSRQSARAKRHWSIALTAVWASIRLRRPWRMTGAAQEAVRFGQEMLLHHMDERGQGSLFLVTLLLLDNHKRAGERAHGLHCMSSLLDSGAACGSIIGDLLLCLPGATRATTAPWGGQASRLDGASSPLRAAVQSSFHALLASMLGVLSSYSSGSRPLDCHTLLLLLNSWGVTLSASDWAFIESSRALEVIASVAALLEQRSEELTLLREPTNHRSPSPKGRRDASKGLSEEQLLVRKCHACSWALLRLLVAQLPAVGRVGVPLNSVFQTVQEEMRVAVAAIGTESSLSHVGLGIKSHSNRRRCQELVHAPRRLMHMEDGLSFPGEQMLSNPKGSDFSITFWLLLLQDCTGQHRTVLARGHKSVRWPVVLLRDTDCRIEVCFGLPSMGSLCERLTSKEAVTLSKWTHVALVSEGSHLRLYFNGTLDHQRNNTGVPRANSHPLYVGKVPGGAIRLDGVRGGFEGSIANLRFYTRALSPIHVRIICDPGPPEMAPTKDHRCYQLCAALTMAVRSSTCRVYLSQPEWLDILLKAFVGGTTRVQQAVVRLFHDLLPHIQPQAMGKLQTTLCKAADMPTATNAPEAPMPNEGGQDTSGGTTTFTIFVSQLLRIVGITALGTITPHDTLQKTSRQAEGAKADGNNNNSNKNLFTLLHPLHVVTALAHLVPDHLTAMPTEFCNGEDGETENSFKLSTDTVHRATNQASEIVHLLRKLASFEAWAELWHAPFSTRQPLVFALPHICAPPGPIQEVLKHYLCQLRGECLPEAYAALLVVGGHIDGLRVGIEVELPRFHSRSDPAVCFRTAADSPLVSKSLGYFILCRCSELAQSDSPCVHFAFICTKQVDTSLGRGTVVEFDPFTTSSLVLLQQNKIQQLNADELKVTTKQQDRQCAKKDLHAVQCRSRCAKVLHAMTLDREWASLLLEAPDIMAMALSNAVQANEIPKFITLGEAEVRAVAIHRRLCQLLGFPGRSASSTEAPGAVVVEPDEGGSGEEDLACPFCLEQEFPASQLVEHVLQRHAGDTRRVPCPLCVAEKADHTAWKLATHLELKHMRSTQGEVASELVEQLMIIGFPEEWCIMALRENNGNVVNASTWIVDNLEMLSSLHSLSLSRATTFGGKVVEVTGEEASSGGRERESEEEDDGDNGSEALCNLSGSGMNEEDACDLDHFEHEGGAGASASSFFPEGRKAARSSFGSLITEVAAMDSAELFDALLETEEALASLYCRAAVINLLLQWSGDSPMSPEILGKPCTLLRFIRMTTLRGDQVPVDASLSSRTWPCFPMCQGASAPTAASVMYPFLKRLLEAEASAGSEKLLEPQCHAIKVVLAQPYSFSSLLPRDLEESLSYVLTSSSLDDLDAAAWGQSDMNWGSRALEAADSQRLGPYSQILTQPSVELAHWLLDLLLTCGCGIALSDNTFSRLGHCLRSPNMPVKEVAMYSLSCIAMAWHEHVARSSPVTGPAASALPSPLAMEDTMQRNISLQKIRATLTRCAASKMRRGSVLLPSYMQTMTELFIAGRRLQKALVSSRDQQDGREEAINTSLTQLPPLKLEMQYATDTIIALTWAPARIPVDGGTTPNLSYEVEIAVKQLSGDFFGETRVVYSGRRLRCKVEGLMPSQTYDFRVRALYPGLPESSWCPFTAFSTQAGVAFTFDRSECAPAIFVSGDLLSASYGSNESWSTLLGTTPFVCGSNYWEVYIDKSPTSYLFIGVAYSGADPSTFLGGDAAGWGYIGDCALYHKRAKVKSYGERFGQGDTIGVLLDMDRWGLLSFSRNGIDLGVAFDGLAGELYPAVAFYNQGQRVTLLSTSFQCSGAGISIKGSPTSVNPEDILELAETMEAMVAGTQLPQTKLKEAYSHFEAWSAGNTVRQQTCCGYELQFDASVEACAAFKMRAGSRVRTPRGNATVVGVYAAAMWLLVDGEAGAWFFGAEEIEEGQSVGFFLERGEHTPQVPCRSSLPFDEFTELASCQVWTHEMDAVIIRPLNEHAEQLRVLPWNLPPTKVLELTAGYAAALARIAGRDITDIAILCRVALLHCFNQALSSALPYVNLVGGLQVSGCTASRSFYWGQASGLEVRAGRRGLGPLLAALRGSIFYRTKQRLLNE